MATMLNRDDDRGEDDDDDVADDGDDIQKDDDRRCHLSVCIMVTIMVAGSPRMLTLLSHALAG